MIFTEQVPPNQKKTSKNVDFGVTEPPPRHCHHATAQAFGGPAFLCFEGR